MRDWEAALNHVMPKRKFCAEGKHSKSKVSIDGDEVSLDSPKKTVTEPGRGMNDDSNDTPNGDHGTED